MPDLPMTPRQPAPPRLATFAACLAATLALLFVATLDAPHAHAQVRTDGDWLVLPLDSRAADADTVDIATDLLVDELRAGGQQARRATGASPCNDPDCAVAALRDRNASLALVGSISRLGERWLLSVSVINPDGQSVAQQRFSVDRVEEIDTAATRVVRAILTGRPIEQGARLGQITSEEARPDTRRDAQRGTLLRLSGATPLGQSFGHAHTGVGIDLGYSFEARHFALEPRAGVRWAPSTRDDDTGGFVETVFDFGAFWLPSDGNISPLLGGGAGLRWIRVPYNDVRQVGSVIVVTQEDRRVDHGFGFGTYARAGVLLLRTYTFRMSMAVDYNLIAIEVDGRPLQHMLTFGVAAHF